MGRDATRSRSLAYRARYVPQNALRAGRSVAAALRLRRCVAARAALRPLRMQRRRTSSRRPGRASRPCDCLREGSGVRRRARPRPSRLRSAGRRSRRDATTRPLRIPPDAARARTFHRVRTPARPQSASARAPLRSSGGRARACWRAPYRVRAGPHRVRRRAARWRRFERVPDRAKPSPRPPHRARAPCRRALAKIGWYVSGPKCRRGLRVHTRRCVRAPQPLVRPAPLAKARRAVRARPACDRHKRRASCRPGA